METKKKEINNEIIHDKSILIIIDMDRRKKNQIKKYNCRDKSKCNSSLQVTLSLNIGETNGNKESLY